MCITHRRNKLAGAVLLAALGAVVRQSGAGAESGTPPAEALVRARATLQSMTRQLARYACVETVDRSYYEPPPDAVRGCARILAARNAQAPLKLKSTDRLRLEVTLADGREIHAWPGATRFDVRNVDQIIHQGPVSTGTFGTHLIGVFDNPGTVFEFAGAQASDGRNLLEYHFRVPLEASQYHVRTRASWQAVPYEGSFWLDAASLELQRFALTADALPPVTGMCQLHADLDYHRVHIGEGNVLLPQQDRLDIVMQDASETSNVIRFSDCREYQADAELRFDANPEETDTEAAAKREIHAPVSTRLGLPIELALTAAIDTDTAAAGDPVSAKVAKPVRTGDGKVLIPADAVVRGRITRLEHHLFPQPYFLVAISFNRLVEGEISSPFAAKHDPDPEMAKELWANLKSYGRGVDFWDVGTFLFPTKKPRYVLPAGKEMKWETLAQ